MPSGFSQHAVGPTALVSTAIAILAAVTLACVASAQVGLPAAEESGLREALGRATIVAKVEVDHLYGASKVCLRHPAVCASGRVDARQTVRYRLLEVLRGDLEEGALVDIDQAMYPGSPLMAADAFRLDPGFFAEGREFFVLAEYEVKRVVSDDRQYALLEPSRENEVLLRRLLAETRQDPERGEGRVAPNGPADGASP